jgi:hypothetical protein
VLLILGGALTSAYLVMASGQRVSAIGIKSPVPAGQLIPAEALQEVQIGDTGISFLRWTELDKVTRAYAAVPLVPGSLLTNEMMINTNEAVPGRVTVGLALKPGQLPSKALGAGEHVAVYAVGGQNSGVPAGTVLSTDAIVLDVRAAGETSLESGQTRISVGVPPEQAPALTQAASAGAVAVAFVPAGTTVSPSDPTGGKSALRQTPAQNTQQNTTLGGRQQASAPGGG